MDEAWLSIIGLGEDGLNGLSGASLSALQEAEIVFGGARHLALAQVGEKGQAWPSPFSIAPVLQKAGRRVAVLVSGDPFWHGAGSLLAQKLKPSEWRAFPAPSTFSRAAAQLGWPLEDVQCLGLHAAPFEQLMPILSPGVKVICLLRDASSPADLAAWLTTQGFGPSQLHVLEALGGPRAHTRTTTAKDFDLAVGASPVAVAIEVAGRKGLPQASGRPDDVFISDGQMTKRPIRALALSALAPRPHEVLWDIGAGSGTIAVEWLLSCPSTKAITLEQHPERSAFIKANAQAFGLAHRLDCVTGLAPSALSTLPKPDAVFLGGGASEEMLLALWGLLPVGTRLVAHSVTLETESLLIHWHGLHGGQLLRVDLAEAAPLGRKHGWDRARPIIQWSVTK